MEQPDFRGCSGSHLPPCPPPPAPSAKKKKGPLAKRGRAGLKDVNWMGVRDPEERRRIQNRIAQRKFREKAREQKEKADREAQNMEHAGNIYRIPLVQDLAPETELSGLPWGGVNLSHFIARGYEAESARSGYVETSVFMEDESLVCGNAALHFGDGLDHHYHHLSPSWGSSGTEDVFADETSYLHARYWPSWPRG